MIKLNQSASQYLQLITGQNGAVVDVSYSDKSSADFLGDSQLTSIVTATTTTICDTPAASVVRYIDFIAITNTFAGNNTITVQQNSSATAYPIVKDLVMSVGDRLEYTHACGWKVTDAYGAIHTVATADVGAAIAAAPNKTTPIGADKIGIWDSVSGLLNSVLFSNLNLLWANIAGSASQVFSVATATAAGHAVRFDQISTAVKSSFPIAVSYNAGTAQALTTNVYAAITVDTELVDNTNSSVNGLFTAPVAGWYQVHGILRVNSATITQLQIDVYKNGVSAGLILNLTTNALSSAHIQPYGKQIKLAAGDTCQTWVMAQGTTLTVTGTTSYQHGIYLVKAD